MMQQTCRKQQIISIATTDNQHDKTLVPKNNDPLDILGTGF